MLKVFLPERLAEATDEAIRLDQLPADPDRIDFQRWHQPPLKLGFEANFFLFALLQRAPDQIPDSLGVHGSLRHSSAANLEETLDRVASDNELWKLLSRPADLPERVEALRAALRAVGGSVPSS